MTKSSVSTNLLLFFCFTFSMSLFGQERFGSSKEAIWIKGFTTYKNLEREKVEPLESGTSKELSDSNNVIRELNYHTPIQFSDNFKILNSKYKASKYTYVFYVLKSKELNKKLFSLYHAGNLHSFYTDKIKSDTEVNIDVNALKNGSIVHFNFYNKDFYRKDEGIFFLENFQAKSESELYEVIICNSCLESELKYKVETYLALKYGITLSQKNNYYASDQRKVWDEKLDTKFNNHIIGLAKDSYFNLEQKASYSNTDPLLVVRTTMDSLNSELKDFTYMLIGDNSGGKVFDANSGVYKRRWLVQNKGDHDVIFDVNLDIEPQGDLEYLLFSSEETYLNEQTDSLQLNFKGLKIESNQHYYLTLLEKVKFNFKINQEDDGFNTKNVLGVNRAGTAPFTITAINNQTLQEYTFVSEIARFDLQDLPKATYSFTVRDAVDQIAEIKSFQLEEVRSLVNLDTLWLLERGKTLDINPFVATKDLVRKLDFNWYEGEKLLSKAPNLFVNRPGDFVLKVSNKKGKSLIMPFTVNSISEDVDISDSGWKVSPNPVDRGQEFMVTYSFDNDKKVDFYIYTLEGKLILRDQLGTVRNERFTYTLEGASTYLLVAVINDKASMLKLLVK